MVARKTNKGKKQPKRTQQVRQKIMRPVGGMAVEKAVRDYIALLKDPCNGPLVGPVGATANGYITRFEKTITVNLAQPHFWLTWVPGALSGPVTGVNGLSGVEAPTLAAGVTTTVRNDSAPGYSFLNDTCQTFRCLAACAQIRYTDTEVNRKGVLGSAICTGARTFVSVEEALSITVDRARVPDQSLEVLWQPGEGDETFLNWSATTAPDSEARARKNGIHIAGTNCGAGGAVSIRLVVVYQWTPSSNDSMILPVPRPGTGVTMARVIQLAQQAGFVAGHLLKGYATGGLYGVAREAASMIRPSVRLMAN